VSPTICGAETIELAYMSLAFNEETFRSPEMSALPVMVNDAPLSVLSVVM
jgi:hypothetical protein